MNIKNLDKLIAALEAAPDEKFDIRSFFSRDGKYAKRAAKNSCNTAACVAGWAVWLSKQKTGDPANSVVARQWLGMEWVNSHLLFYPPKFHERPELYPRSRAIATLKRLRKTGKVDWGGAS